MCGPLSVHHSAARSTGMLHCNVCLVFMNKQMEMDRTNNHAEGWNSHLQHLIGHQHPSIWRLIEALQADTAESATKILRYAAVNLSPKRQSKTSISTA